MAAPDMIMAMGAWAQGVRDSYEADGRALEPSAPLVVLVNRGTASASEARTPVSLKPLRYY